MPIAKWKKGLPKWRQKLTMELNMHLVMTTDSATKAQFFANRKFQERYNITCYACEAIERSLNAK